jgi:hypothetical protein
VTLYVETGFDLEAHGPISFTLTENGIAVGVVQMIAGTYFLTIDGTTVTRPDFETVVTFGWAPFLPALKAALEAVGAGTYTVTFDAVTQRITISVTGVATFSMSGFNAHALKVLGYTTALGNASSHTSARAPWYRIQTNLGCLTDFFWDAEEDGDLGEEVIAHDGIDAALAEDELPVKFDAVLPHEPRAIVWNEFASTSVPFTWQRLFRHVRNVVPVCFDFADGTITRKFFVRFRREGRLFAPRPRPTPVGKNWWEAADIAIMARRIGHT